ncbi:MAG: VWA domain-containing protein [Deltaproteobacteria bacterium]|nr:VWA domain-containing protein [Deltaproteobacteria bacterium]
MRRSLLLALLVLAASERAGAIGLLVPTDPGVGPLQLVSHRVEAKVVERGAVTTVTQEFQNNTDRQLEATYLFPLPKGASIDEFALWMNGKRETGKVMERAQARAIYESIVRRARDPGLIEYVDSEMFEARVFPIPPRGKQKIELKYSHVIDYEGGLARYVYPMKTDQRATQTLQDFTFSVRIESKAEIKNFYSPTHKMATNIRGKGGMASLEKNAFSLADDLALYWQVNDEDVGVSLLSYQEGDEPGYFMLLASPKDGFRNNEIIGKRVAFVVDTSGSMEGDKMEATKRALDQCLTKLGEDDLFSIVTFGGYAEAWKEKMVAASKSNIEAARAHVRKIEPLGGTNIDEALRVAFSTATGSDKAPLMVVFMTDGRPTVGDTDVKNLLTLAEKERTAKAARLFVLGVGDDLNAVLLDKMSSANGGSALYLKGSSALEAEVASFYDKISHPVLADLKLDISGVTTYGAHPRALGDLFKGQQLVVVGRYRNPGKARIKLSGSTPKGSRVFELDANFLGNSTEHAFIPRIWAQRQVGMLLDEIRVKGESAGLVEEVTQLATRFGIVTPYTSYLVLEPGMNMPPPPTRRMVMGMEERRVEDEMGRPDDRPRPESPPAAAPAESRDGFGLFDSITGGDKGGGRGGPAGAATPAKPADVEKAKKDARERLKNAEGESAVSAAKELGSLKTSTTVDGKRVATTVQSALGRAFTFKDGYYVDEKCKPADKTLEVKAFSDAYFQVLKLRPDLKSAMALGEQVKVSVGAGRTLVVSSKGPDKVDAATLASFVKR